MLKTSIESRPVRSVGPRYFFMDPIRLGAMACAIALMVTDYVPLWLTIASIAVSQANGIAMIAGILGRGWSSRWGRRSRQAVLASTLASDWTNTSVCTLVGAMLLLRHFGPPEIVVALGLLAIGISLLPDVRLCRALLSSDLHAASRTLSEGYFFRDPMKLGGLVALLILCTLDDRSLSFIFLSMALLQVNSVLILIDKYVNELERPRTAVIIRNPALRMLIDRDGQRVLIMLLPFLFVPFRLSVSPAEARWVAAAIAALIIVPDLLRTPARVAAAIRLPRTRLSPAPTDLS
jgi:hypothetical protein